jgi:hypothetical protein
MKGSIYVSLPYIYIYIYSAVGDNICNSHHKGR